MGISRFLLNLRDLPKSVYFNFLTLPFKQACKLPIWIKYNTILPKKLEKGMCSISGGVYSKMITIGIYGSPGLVGCKKTQIILAPNSKMNFVGTAQICEGCTLRCDGGILSFGTGFSVNSNSIIWSTEKIEFGDDVLIGYYVYIRDSDGHYLIENGIKKECTKPIIISNHVWIGAYAKILKGVSLGRNTVVALDSCVTKSFGAGLVIAGSPAREIRRCINWSLD